MIDERVKLPPVVKAFLLFYVGFTGIHLSITQYTEEEIFRNVFLLTALAIFSAFFSYGVICFIADIKSGGIGEVIKRIRKAFEK